MQQELIDKLRGLTAQDLRLWTDSRYVERGRSYLSRVGEPKWSDGSLVARVRGTQTYTTELFLDASGELEAECSCPVGGRCKHAVALALYAAQLSRTGMEFAGESGKKDGGEAPPPRNVPFRVSLSRNGVLFWFVAVPGVKAVSGLRDLTRIPCQSQREGNEQIAAICEQMYESGVLARGRHEPYGGVARNTYRLAKHLSISALRKLAMEAEQLGWWPDEDDVKKLCDAPCVRAMLREDKDWYEGQHRRVFAVSQGIRQLLIGRGAIPGSEANEERVLALAAQWLAIVADGENLLDVADPEHLPISFAVRLLDLAFAKGRAIRPALETLIALCRKHPRGLSVAEGVEIASFCIWTGRIDLIERFFEIDWTDDGLIRFLGRCLQIEEERGVFETYEAIRHLGTLDGGFGRFEKCPAFRLLGAALAVRAGAEGSEVAKVAFAGRRTTNYGAWNAYKYPPANVANGTLAEVLCELHDLLEHAAHASRGRDWPWAFRYLGESERHEGQFPYIVSYYILYSYLRGLKIRLDDETVFPLVRSFREGFGAADKGYPTLAGVLASAMAGSVDAMQVTDLARRVDEAKGVWIFPYLKPEESWKETLEELQAAVPKAGTATRKEKREKQMTGMLVWGMRLNEVRGTSGLQERLYRLGGLAVAYRSDDERYVKEISLRDAASQKYAPCRIAQDEALICEAAYYREGNNRKQRNAVVDALVAHPHVAAVIDRYGYGAAHYGAKTEFREVTFVRGELTIGIEKRPGGDLLLTVPEWAMRLNSEYCIRCEGDRRYAYYEPNAEQKRILDIFERRGSNGTIQMPAEAEWKVREWVARAAPVARIGGEAGLAYLAKDGALRKVEGDATPVVRLVFAGSELTVSLGVIPYAGGVFVPALLEGNESAVVPLDGERVLLTRDSARETAASEKVRRVLDGVMGWLGEIDFETSEWTFDELEDSLNVLCGLKELGDAVRIEWPEGTKIRLSDMDDSTVDFSDFKTERNWFAVRGSFKVDSGKVLDIVEMLNAMEGQTGEFVRLSDGEFIRLSKSLQRRLAALKAAGAVRKDGVEVSPAAVPMLAKEFGDGTGDGLPKALRESARRMAKELSRKVSVPSSLAATLRPYQREGYEWLARHAACGFGACLADDMGLGKTVQIISLLLNRASDGPSLVVAPASVCGNWRTELKRFAPSLRVFMGWEFDPDEKRPFSSLGADDVIVTSYGMAVTRKSAFASREWNGLVLDEAQAIKNDLSKRAHAVKSFRAGFRVVATGTPVENRLTELWSIFDFLNPGLLGPSATFAERLTTKDGMATEGLKRLVAPFILRRRKASVLTDLPEKTEVTLSVELGDEERTAYEACRIRALENLKGNEENRISILAELTRLRRFCCHPSLVLPKFAQSAKLDTLRELLSDLRDGGHRALVFSQFTDYLAIVRTMLEKSGWAYQYLDGTTPIAERGKAVDAFQHGEGDFFLISLKAGGTGLNLTAANYVVLLDPWWNPAVENQAADRAHRIGQKNPVTVYRLIAAKTVEERVLELHDEKRRIADDVLEGTSSTRLTPEALMRLFA